MAQTKFKRGQTTKYLVDGLNTNFTEVYAAVGDLQEAIESAGGGSLYNLTKHDLSASDASLLSTLSGMKSGDVTVITTIVDSKQYEKSAYFYNGTTWEAMTGNVDAGQVILQEDITLAGNYTSIGNVSKGSNTGTSTLSAKGKSVVDVLKSIMTKAVAPTKYDPSVTGFSMTATVTKAGASTGTASTAPGSYEYGVTIKNPVLTAATLNPGYYTNDGGTTKQDTGIVVNSSGWTVKRDVTKVGGNVDDANIVSGGTSTAKTDEIEVVLGDTTVNGKNVVSMLKYTASASYDASTIIAKDNLGGTEGNVKIDAGAKSQTTGQFTGYRNYFYGFLPTSTAEAPITSDLIRGLTKSGKSYTAGKITVKASDVSGAKRFIFACVTGKTGITHVNLDSFSSNSPITSTYVKQDDTIPVNGANGYVGVQYQVWVYEPDKVDSTEIHTITLS